MSSAVSGEKMESSSRPFSWPCCATDAYSDSVGLGRWMQFRPLSSSDHLSQVVFCCFWGLLGYSPPRLLRKNKTQMLSSSTTALNDLAAPEAVGLAEDRLDGLQRGGTPTPHLCRVLLCPSDALHPVCNEHETLEVGCEGDGELLCAPGGHGFRTISHTDGQHSWQTSVLVSIFRWLSCLRQLLVLLSRKSHPCWCPHIWFPVCNYSAAVWHLWSQTSKLPASSGHQLLFAKIPLD